MDHVPSWQWGACLPRGHAEARAVRDAERHHAGGAVTLGPIISQAFEQPEVTLDVFTLTSESLNMHIGVQNERIRTGQIAPRSITLRMLLPSEGLDVPYPRAKDDPDDPRLRDRLNDLTSWHTCSVRSILRALELDGLVPSVQLEIRHVQLTPTFKLYLLNGTDALHALYEPVELSSSWRTAARSSRSTCWGSCRPDPLRPRRGRLLRRLSCRQAASLVRLRVEPAGEMTAIQPIRDQYRADRTLVS